MPELPEVETVRAGLEPFVVGATVADVEVFRDSCVRLLPGGPEEFQSRLLGATIMGAVRRGKFLWMPVAFPSVPPHPELAVESLSAHLGMSGQFRVHAADEVPAPHPHCRARLSLRREGRVHVLDFLDQRTFGYLNVEPLVPTADASPGGQGSDLAAVPSSVAHIGRDPLDPACDDPTILRGWRRGQRAIKQVLLDQTVASGIGNIYADEALWHARIHPERPASALSAPQSRALLDAARTVMSDALVAGGTSFDALYVNVNGESGYFERGLEAYGRGGLACSRCGSTMRRATVGGRATHWCARCQRRWAPRRVSR
ncbi:bifunctional DNA-formamidopyrimidine glycosylase/DNA-(apurinic or apyrimidinic site) lyase [Demequina sediminicola]|uniref:bifunctional DNA-formamidopyrimidine glycosylase/DNA-(apurinic or apyrimidinic site) lyase n=1 Tax=Demequina sediminicola TaxID=1095026 RepID=UPI000785FB11|nr:bifunctional DNA-formamidopyrimidine glycosylase/DNA-(apurinic or apyrimidinic site) lyase [Demequina sediminicola]